MKQYIMNEEELIQCIKDWTIQGYVPAYFIKNNFLKSKTSIKVIAEGEVIRTKWMNSPTIGGVTIHSDKLEEGKKGKLIFIEDKGE